MPGAPSSVLAPSSDARSLLLLVMTCPASTDPKKKSADAPSFNVIECGPVPLCASVARDLGRALAYSKPNSVGIPTSSRRHTCFGAPQVCYGIQDFVLQIHGQLARIVLPSPTTTDSG